MSKEYQETFDFSGALKMIKEGKRLARLNWNGKDMWVCLFPNSGCQLSDAQTIGLTHPFLVIEYPVGSAAYPEGSCIPWLASQTDLLAEDWFEFREVENVG